MNDNNKYAAAMHELCAQVGARYVVQPKTPSHFKSTSNSSFIRHFRVPQVATATRYFEGERGGYDFVIFFDVAFCDIQDGAAIRLIERHLS